MRARPLPVAVVGGGPAGLASAAALGRLGLAPVVLEQGPSIGHSWRGRYDRLRLNTSRLTSRLGRARYPRDVGMFPTRDEFVAYLERFATGHDIDVRTGIRVERLDPVDSAWRLSTPAGVLRFVHVIVATGYAREPFTPPWRGRDAFGGVLVHAADYRNAEAFRGADVLVVGAGSSGMEIAYDLAEGGARRVRLSVRTPPNILLRSVARVPGDPAGVAMTRLPARLADAQVRAVTRLVLGDLSEYGLSTPAEGPFARLRRLGVSPAVVDRDVIRAITARQIEIVAGVKSLEPHGASLADGSRIDAHAIIAATGYRCGLEGLAGHLGILDERGIPRISAGREAAPGLRFVGFRPVPGQIRLVGIEARRAARTIAMQAAVRRLADGARLRRPRPSAAGGPRA